MKQQHVLSLSRFNPKTYEQALIAAQQQQSHQPQLITLPSSSVASSPSLNNLSLTYPQAKLLATAYNTVDLLSVGQLQHSTKSGFAVPTSAATTSAQASSSSSSTTLCSVQQPYQLHSSDAPNVMRKRRKQEFKKQADETQAALTFLPNQTALDTYNNQLLSTYSCYTLNSC